MKPTVETPWPPSQDALDAIACGSPDARGPVDAIRRQHLEMASLLADLAQVADSLAVPGPEDTNLRRRLGACLGVLNRFLEAHRDAEESILFPELLATRPELSPALDDLSDEHLQIFADNRALNGLLDRLDLEPRLLPSHREALTPILRSFLERLWRHTLTEETLLRGPMPR